MSSWRERVELDAESPLDDDFGKGKGHCPNCRTEWFGFKICHCPTCHLTFTAVGGFDFHRTGKNDARRCRTADELAQSGYEPNDQGQWRKPAPAGLYVKDTEHGAVS